MPYLPALHPELIGFHTSSNHKLSARKMDVFQQDLMMSL
jgi:hypothetical protein